MNSGPPAADGEHVGGEQRDPGPSADAEGAPTAANPDGIPSRALSIGVAVGAYAVGFGAISVAAGLDVLQTQALSALMFTGASQFAFVGVVAAGGGLVAAVLTAWLLGLRNGLYALHMATVLSPRGRPGQRVTGLRRLGAAQFTIDESTAMAMTYEPDAEASRRAFWATGWSVFILWNLGTLVGALGAATLSDPTVLGLDAAIPAGFLAPAGRPVRVGACRCVRRPGAHAGAAAPTRRPGAGRRRHRGSGCAVAHQGPSFMRGRS